ncbi:DUF397 domain-containing protein [Nonomuraea jabiensis]|uniref:DUF397 domain-containing protein n=1 Tax=Nonomuraea jabiensis TaxID=882448 RepID=UPI0034165947
MTVWKKSSKCNGAAACVEVAVEDGLILLRDSKNPDGPVLKFTPEQWQRFKEDLK